MGHPTDNIEFDIQLPSIDGKYHFRYPNGDWPGDPASASGAGVVDFVSTSVGLATGAVSTSGAGKIDTATAAAGTAGGGGAAAGSSNTDTATAPAGSASGAGGGGGGSGFTPAAGVSISGTFADGQTVTITRAAGGLGARTNAKPLYWYPMETNASTDDAFSRTSDTLTSPSQVNRIFQSGVAPAGAAGAMQWTPQNTGGGAAGQCGFNREPFWTINGDVFMFVKRRVGFDPDNDKIWRGWSVIGNFPDCYYGVNAATGCLGSSDAPSTQTTGISSIFTATPFNPNTWYHDEHYFRNGTLNNNDGIMQWCRQGNCAWEIGGRWRTQASGAAGTINKFFLDEYTNSPPNGSSNLSYYGCIYVDDSFLQLYVTDEGSTYGTTRWTNGLATHIREIQLQTSRSDTSITFRIRKGSHASLSGKNLIVTTGLGTSINLGTFN